MLIAVVKRLKLIVFCVRLAQKNNYFCTINDNFGIKLKKDWI